ncbi:MAG: phenylacetate--CoA ligase, partial [Lentisphaeria bacterium]|nr:phenylacetate--CoA ligase [Lentisphaeria bacterium]
MSNAIKGVPAPGYDPISASDYIPPEKMREIQLERFIRVVKNAYENVPLYRQRFDEAHFDVDSFKSLEDVKRLPFTKKVDLRDTYPYGLFARPLKDIVRLHASSGTTGKPIVVAYTQADLDVWQQTMCRSLAAVGICKEDIVQNSYGYGLFTGGLGAHAGAEGLGAAVIPASGGNTARQIMLM